MAFEPGEVVMLKSGGHSMTVASVEGDGITCLWISESGAFFRETIPAVALELVFSPNDDEHDDEEHEDDEHEDDEEDEDDEEEDDEEEEDEEDKADRKKRAR